MKKVLVTGVSKGIGKTIAETFINHGYEVIGTCREPEKLPNNQKIPNVIYQPLDLSISSSIQNLVKSVGDIDILINNAGVSQYGSIEDTSMERARYLFDVNLFGTTELIQGLLPKMRNRKSGLIITISSIAAVFPVPFNSFYSASKKAIEAVCIGLESEVHKWGIKVIIIEPGHINTGLIQEKCFDDDSAYSKLAMRVKKIREHMINNGSSPQIVADKVMKIINKKNPAMIYSVGSNAPFLRFIEKFIPTRTINKIIRKRTNIE